jgi:hypothetical protein
MIQLPKIEVDLDVQFKPEDLIVRAFERYTFSFNDWRGIWGTYETTLAAPHIWVPKLTLPQAVAVGAAAAIIKNPVITRRFWAGWTTPRAAPPCVPSSRTPASISVGASTTAVSA